LERSFSPYPRSWNLEPELELSTPGKYFFNPSWQSLKSVDSLLRDLVAARRRAGNCNIFTRGLPTPLDGVAVPDLKLQQNYIIERVVWFQLTVQGE